MSARAGRRELKEHAISSTRHDVVNSKATDCVAIRRVYIETTESVVSALAIGTLAFLYTLQLSQAFISDKKLADFVLYLTSGLLLAPVCAVWLTLMGRSRRLSYLSRMHVQLATVTMAMLVIGSFVQPFWVRIGFASTSFASVIIAVSACVNAGAIVYILATDRTAPTLPDVPRRVNQTEPTLLVSVFAATLILTLLVFFNFNPQKPLFFWVPLIGESPFALTGLSGLGSFAVALVIVAAAAILAEAEVRMKSRGSSHLNSVRQISLCVAVLLLPLLFFDFSLSTEVLHFLTNMAPAIQLQHGGVLMVDTFSQYGPGPVLATLGGFKLFGNSFGAAGITVQIFNLLFYAIWLVCLYRASPLKISALVLGLCLICILMTVWGLGNSNINFAPSILGFRYLPILLMVLAVSCLRPSSTRSLWTDLAMFLAALWSVEAFGGALLVQAGFSGMQILLDRSWRRLVIWAIQIILPAIVAVGILSLYALAVGGSLPDYPMYLAYLSAYNFLSGLWSMPANASFFGWLAILCATFLCLFDAWCRVLQPNASTLAVSSHNLFYRFVPMALLCFVMSSYYAGRSVDYVVVLALLPFGALVMPALAWMFEIGRRTKSKVAFGTLLIYATFLTVGIGFSVSALSRPDGQYQFAGNVCVGQGQCSIRSVVNILLDKMAAQPVLEKVGNGYADAYFDTRGVVRDTVKLLKRPDIGARAVVLIGSVRDDPILQDFRDQIATDISLFYAGKWHLWPRSDTFVDELLPQRVDQILASPIKLEERAVILVRRDEARLGKIERGILARIRAEFNLCELKDSTPQVIAYRLVRRAFCDSD